MTTLRIRDLGPLVLEEDGQPRRVPTGTLSTALALLAVHAGRRVGTDELAEAIWGDRTTTRSASTLDSHVLRLRKVLEPRRRSREASSVLVNDSGGLRLAARPDQVDSLRFARLAADSADLLAQGAADRALRRAEEALSSWRGRPYGDAADAPWATAAVARLEELHAQVRETRIGALLGSGAIDRALVELEAAVAEHPLRERLWAYRMTAYRDAGRRADALDAYTEARTTLVEELGLEPGPELRALHAALLTDGPVPSPSPRTARPRAVHLPAVRTRILGRDTEATELAHRITTHPLVTIAGTAGCGKTRLAIEIAGRTAPAFTDGVWFVDLTSATPDRVPEVVCSTLELPAPVDGDPASGLRSLARDRRALLVLDNCEHVLDAVAELVEQLQVTDGEAAVLATSREPLEVTGEHVHGLAPLESAPAVELFLQRVAATGSRQADPEAADRIVAALDGLPLALELAAGRARSFSLAEIAMQVRADASGLSHTGRGRAAHHRSLRGAIDSSYRMLPAPEAALHRALGAVPGPFTADLAAALAGTAEVADLLGGLVHRSLLTPLGSAGAGGASRFAQLATLRSHAQHEAAALGEHPAARRDAWVDALVDRQPPFGSTALQGWHRALDDDLPALRATLQHTVVDAPSARGLRLAGRLTVYWGFGGGGHKGMHWIRAAVAASERDPDLGTGADRALIRIGLAAQLLGQSRGEEGRRLLRAGITHAASAETATDADLLCGALALAAGPVITAGDVGLALEVAAAARQLGSGARLDVLVRHTELVAPLLTGTDPDMLARLQTLHTDARATGNHYTGWVAAVSAAQLLLHRGLIAEALVWARHAVADSVAMGMRENHIVVEVLGGVLAFSGEMAAAARAFAMAEGQTVRGGVRWPTFAFTEAHLDTVAIAVGRDGTEQARADAAVMTLADLAADQ